MNNQVIVDLARHALLTTAMMAGPMLAVALGVGLIVSVLQAVTQIQEQTLTFVPKLLAVGGVFLISLPWILQLIIRFTIELFRMIPGLAN